MATNPCKVDSSSSEHLTRSYPERDMGSVSYRWWGALCFQASSYIFKAIWSVYE